MTTTNDPFAPTGRPEPKRDRYGRYLLTDPVTGKERAWQRTTTFTKMASDTFNLTQWAGRNIAKGLSLRPDLLALASTMDIKRDAKQLNALCEDAKEAAGAKTAANTGTALHSFTEAHDEDRHEAVPEMYRPRIRQYDQALKDHGITILPGMIERIVVSTKYDVAGTFDRVVRLEDETHVIFDLKTGRDLSYGMNEIAIQLACYADAHNAHGVWDAERGRWADGVPKVRDDFALVAHLPAAGDGCTIYKIDLQAGREGADLCAVIRDWRKRKGVGEVWEPPATDWTERVLKADTRKELEHVASAARIAGEWDSRLREVALVRLDQISS
jgi:hypothetical protein